MLLVEFASRMARAGDMRAWEAFQEAREAGLSRGEDIAGAEALVEAGDAMAQAGLFAEALITRGPHYFENRRLQTTQLKSAGHTGIFLASRLIPVNSHL